MKRTGKLNGISEILRNYRDNGNFVGVRLPVIKDPDLSWFMGGLINIVKEIRLNGVDTPDYCNPANLGIKPNGSLGMFDLGFGNPYDDYDSLLGKIVLDEKSDLLKKIKSIMGVGKSRYIGGGMFGYAHDIGNNLVMKITKDRSEAVNSNKIKGKKNKYLSDVKDVRAFETSSGKQLYVIILEKLDTPSKLPVLYKNLEDIINEQRNLHLDISVLDNIKDKLIYNFLHDMVTHGRSYSWSKYMEQIKSPAYKKIDFNSISDISEWIKGSKTNNNFIYEEEVPSYIKRYLKQLSR